MGARYLVILLVLLSLIGIIPIWSVSYPPLQDYPAHLLQANVFLQYDNPTLNYQEFWRIQKVPVPYMGFFLSTVFFGFFFPIFTAGKLALSLYIFIFPLSIFYFITAFSKKKSFLALFTLPFLFNHPFHAGEINFVLGITMFFFTLGYWFRTYAGQTLQTRAILLVLVTLTYITHLFPFLFTCAVIFSTLIYRRKFNDIPPTLTAFLPSTFFFILLLSQQFSFGEIVVRFTHPVTIIKQLFYFFGAYHPRLDTAIVFPVYLAYAALLLKGLLDKKRAASLILFLCAFVVLPFLPYYVDPHFGDIAERVFFPLIFIGLPLLPVPRKKLLFSGILIASFLLMVFVKTAQFSVVEKRMQPILEAYERVPAHSSVFYLRGGLLPEGNIVPAYHIWAYHNIEKGGGMPFLDAIFMPIRYNKNTSVVLNEETVTQFSYVVSIGELPSRLTPFYERIFQNELAEVHQKKELIERQG